MWNLKKKVRKEPEAPRLLATLLLCAPEVARVSYVPEEERLDLAFALKDTPFTQEAFDALGESIVESLGAYHALEGFRASICEMGAEIHPPITFLYIRRDVATFSRGELTLLVTLLKERFRAALIVEEYGKNQDPDFIAAQEDQFDALLDTWAEHPLTESMTGIREEGRIVVFRN